MNNKQKQEWAKTLYIHEGLMQKEIAAKVNVTEKTVTEWKTKFNWDKLKVSFIVTKQEELRRIYEQISELNSAIAAKVEGKRYADSKEADTLNKLAATARQLETDASLPEVIEVFKQFLSFVKKENLEKAQEIGVFCDEFIRNKLN